MERRFQTDPIKIITPLLWPLEQKWIAWAVPRLPNFLNGVSLTLLSILWSILIIIFGWLAKNNLHWLWGFSASVAMHYLCDALDGAVGRYRHSGLVNWGYFMDHLFDFFFLCAIVIAYSFILPNYHFVLLIILATFGGLMMIIFLTAGITKKFRMSYFRIGATEIIIGIIILNIFTTFYGVNLLKTVLIILSAFIFIVLCYAAYQAQKLAKLEDLKNSPRSLEERGEPWRNQ